MKRPMRFRYVVSSSVLAAVALISLAVVSITGQTPASNAKTGKPASAPRTAWGDPDLQGTWFVLYDVPLERSAANAGKPFLTDEEVAAANKAKGVNPGRNSRSTDASQDVSGAYNAVFNSVLRTGKRTSMVIDPPDGKIPPLVAGAQQTPGRGGPGGRGPALSNDNPETTAQSPRCLGVPMPFLPLNTAFAQGTVMQIVQSPKSLAIYMEDDHAGGGNRVIYMDGRPHAPKSAKFYLGDSRGHWEGNTLVVDITNFNGKGWMGTAGSAGRLKGILESQALHVVERFTRTDENTIMYEARIEDPNAYAAPWKVRIPLSRDPEYKIYEYACHEGNDAVANVLRGGRAADKGN
jgi:hypothetical protein